MRLAPKGGEGVPACTMSISGNGVSRGPSSRLLYDAPVPAITHRKRALSVGALLEKRAVLLDEITAIDAELRQRGVRALETLVVRPRDVAGDVLAVLAKGPKTIHEIWLATGQTKHGVRQMLSKLARAGEVVRVGHGLYRLPGD
jgi:hypothetical protein